jgi:hypothetical protein
VLPVVRRWTPALALVALAGLFAMHGMGDHTATHAGLPGTSTHAGHDLAAMATAPVTEGQAAEGSVTIDPTAPLGDSGAMALCFAVLVGGALGLAWVALRSRATTAGRRTPWPADRVPRGRDPDPPRPLLLGVCRC